MDLRVAGVGEECALAVSFVGGGHVATHRVGGEEEDVAVTACGEQDAVAGVGFDFARDHVANDDALGFTVNEDDVHHFSAGIHFHRAFGYFLFKCLIGTEEELLTGLTAGVEGSLELSTTEGAVVEETTVFTTEGHALSDALVNDVGGDFSETVDVGFTSAEVTTLDGVVEEAVNGVTVILIVFGSVNSALCGDRVSAAGAVLVAEALYLVPQFAKSGGGGGTSKAGTDDEDGVFALVVGVDKLGFKLILGPFVLNRTGRNFCIRHPIACREVNHGFSFLW